MRIVSSRKSSLFESVLKECDLRRGRAIGLSLALATVVAVLDYGSGDEFPLIVCYLPSVIVVCWVSHTAVGVSLAMACCTGWLVDDLLLLEEQPVTAAECWTALTHLMFFLVIIGMLLRLRAALEREEQLARTDSLTGLMNRKAFCETAQRAADDARRTGSLLAMAYLDCDHFKAVNDTHGHCEGDRLLQAIGRSLRETVGSTGAPARMGGDEFAILLPGASREEAEAVIHRMRARLDEVMRLNEWPVTFSIGVMVYEVVPESVDELIHRCDLLMYDVKRRQKDAVAYKLCV